MSCMAGQINFDGKPVDRYFLGKLGASIVQYGPDQADEIGRGGPGEYIHDNVAMIYRPFHTNKESRLERQPYVTYCKETGAVRNVMTWDGRLDNREELMRALAYELGVGHKKESLGSPWNGSAAAYTDVAIVMAAWEAWGTECFKKLIGDFSLAVWDKQERTLTLAKDFIGVRYLYYEILPDGVRGGARTDPELGDAEPPSGPCVWWCSRLEPLILLSGRQYEINEEYIAGYFAFHPANHITPYVGVDALPAGHYVQIRAPFGSGSEVRVSRETTEGLRGWLGVKRNKEKTPTLTNQGWGTRKSRVKKGDNGATVDLRQYWHFDPEKRITYKTDAEYEERFRQVFFQSVKRRLRADAPVIAGLSGGRDSSAIVCVADEIIAKGEAETPRLDTYSRYDEEEPFGNDKPYLTIVEQKRGQSGHHFPASSQAEAGAVAEFPSVRRLQPLDSESFSAHPGMSQGGARNIQRRMEFMRANGYRIILAGTGGDEVTGGVPYYISELADLLVQGRLIRLAAQLKAWSLAQKQPTSHLMLRTVKSWQPGFLRGLLWDGKEVWPWLDHEFVKRQSETFMQLLSARTPRHGLPSFRTRVAGGVAVSWQLANTTKLHQREAKENCYDRGFPFLDRNFLEFMFTIPREQILRPGQYRSLMRRALTRIVPDQILNRTRKAFSVRRPALGVRSIAPEICKLFARSFSVSFGYVSQQEFLKTLLAMQNGQCEGTRPLERTVTLEMWLRSLAEQGLLKRTPTPLESRGKVLESVA